MLSYLHYPLSKPNRIQLKGRHRIVSVVRLVDFAVYDSIDMIPSSFFSLLDFIECFYTYVNRGVKWGEVKYVKTHRSTGASNDSATPSFSIGLHHNFPILHLNCILTLRTVTSWQIIKEFPRSTRSGLGVYLALLRVHYVYFTIIKPNQIAWFLPKTVEFNQKP